MNKSEEVLYYLHFDLQIDAKNQATIEDVKRVAQTILRDQPHYLMGLYCNAKIEFEKKDISAAFKLFDNILKLDRNYFPAWFAKNVCQFKLGDSEAAKQNFLKALQAKMSSFSENAKSFVQIALEKKGVILRPLECEDIRRVLFFCDSVDSHVCDERFDLEELYRAALRNGSLTLEEREETYEFLSLQLPHSQKIKGCAILKFTQEGEGKTLCKIELVHTAKKYERMGLASLLLNYAVQRALEKKCKCITLISTGSGALFYFSHGFMPSSYESDKLERYEWEKKDPATKKEFFSQMPSKELVLNLQDPTILEKMEENLQKTLSKPIA